MRQQSKWPYAILVLFIVIALGTTFYCSLSYHYEMQGDVTELSYFDMEIYGYDAVSAGGGAGNSFTVIGEDPQFILTLTPENMEENGVKYDMKDIGGLELMFGEAWAGKEPLPVQVFYAGMGEAFSEKHSVKSVLEAGQQSLLIPIPVGQYQKFRFDIDGDFKLVGIRSCAEVMAAQAYVSQKTVDTCIWSFPAIIIGFSLIFWAHRVRMRQGGFTVKSYAKNVFLGEAPSPDREIYFDYLRVLAVILVILAHSCSPMVDLADTWWKRLVLVCGLSLGLCCNLLYVMLSGTLLLSSRKNGAESVAAFYIKRASKVIIPLIAYYLLLLYLNGEVHFLPPRNIGNSFKRIMTGAPDVGPHLWLIYTIVALYFVTPFFRVMVQHMSDRLLFAMAIVILALNMLTTYLPLFSMAFGATTFLAGWEGVFLLGYIITRQNNLAGASRRNRIMMIAAIVSYIVMVTVVCADSAQMNYVYGSTPTMVITSCGIFALFVNYKYKFRGKSNVLVRLCSKYSYSIILIHWYALFVVVQGKFHITALRFGCLGGIAASVAVTLIVCIVLAFVFDNTVVIVCNVLFDKLTKGLLDEKYSIRKSA
ncbi:MAG: acyltransferase [Lachnospiraceae bacterium]|nr:acyltransferase [Lachnospiraceae bacterium]